MLFHAHTLIDLDHFNVKVSAHGQWEVYQTDRDVEHRLDSLDGYQDILRPTADLKKKMLKYTDSLTGVRTRDSSVSRTFCL